VIKITAEKKISQQVYREQSARTGIAFKVFRNHAREAVEQDTKYFMTD